MPFTINEACTGCGACPRVCPTGAISGEKKKLHAIDDTLCIECGACGRVCPSAAVLNQSGKVATMVKRSQWEKPEFKDEACMSCTICIDTCPAHCLAMSEAKNSKDPHAYPYLKVEKACIGCGFCAAECPVDAVTMRTPSPKEAKAPLNTGKEAVQ